MESKQANKQEAGDFSFGMRAEAGGISKCIASEFPNAVFELIDCGTKDMFRGVVSCDPRIGLSREDVLGVVSDFYANGGFECTLPGSAGYSYIFEKEGDDFARVVNAYGRREINSVGLDVSYRPIVNEDSFE